MNPSFAPRLRLGLGRGAQLSLPGAGQYLERVVSLAGLLYFACFFVLVSTHGDMAARTSGWLPLRPTIAFVVLSIPIVLYVVLQQIDQGLAPLLSCFRQNAPLLVPFSVLASLSLLSSVQPTAFWGRSGTFVLYPLYNLLVISIAMVLPFVAGIRRSFRVLVVIVLMVLIATTLADVVNPGLFSKHAGRAAGLPENPNASAFLVLACGAVLLDPGRSRITNAAILGATGLGVLLTLSRGGALMFVLLVLTYGGYAFLTGRGRAARHLVIIGAGVLSLAASLTLVAFLARQEIGAFGRSGTRARVGWLTSGEIAPRTDARFALATQYVGYVSEAPLLGYGPGFTATQPKGPHNRYLSEWVNLGMAGLLTYLGLLASALVLFFRRRCPGGVFLVVLMTAYGFFSHNVLENRGLLLLLGMLATLSALPLGRPSRAG